MATLNDELRMLNERDTEHISARQRSIIAQLRKDNVELAKEIKEVQGRNHVLQWQVKDSMDVLQKVDLFYKRMRFSQVRKDQVLTDALMKEAEQTMGDVQKQIHRSAMVIDARRVERDALVDKKLASHMDDMSLERGMWKA